MTQLFLPIQPIPARAGIGWIGKNSCVINRRLGSWFVLGVILTTARIAPDPAAQNHCGTCHRCIDACPTKAIAAPGVVDSNRCISYLTIENKGEIPPELAEKLGDWAFGCDTCQEVCPWNRDVAATTDPDFQPRSGHVRIDLARIEKMSDDSCKALFEGSPIRRAGRDGLLRNLRAGTKKSTS